MEGKIIKSGNHGRVPILRACVWRATASKESEQEQTEKTEREKLRTTIAMTHAIPTRFSRCELSKLLHRTKFGKTGICPQITFTTFYVARIHADTERRFEQENAEGTEFLSVSSVLSCSKIFICVNLRQSASICGQFRIRLRLAALGFFRLFAAISLYSILRTPL